jgi:beta-glucosidase
MKTFIFLTILLQSFVLPARTNQCELTSNDDIQLTENEFIQSRQLCSTSNLPTTNIHRISITSRLVDYTTRCQKSISNANVEIIHIHSKRRSMCSNLYHPNVHGYFNLTNVIIHFNEEVFLRVTALGYKTIYKKILLPLPHERLEEIILNWQIVLTKDIKQSQTEDDERMKSIIDDLMANMTLEEKLGQTNLRPVGFNDSGPIVSNVLREKIQRGEVGAVMGIYTPKAVRQLQELVVNSSRLKIPFIFGFDVIHGYKTIFPIPLALSSTWNMTLIEQSARIAAREATADALNWVFSPMVDIARDPRWGRITEGAGEDPLIGSLVAAAMVRGHQGSNLSSVDTVMSCFKHFGLYGAAEAGRDYNTVDMSLLRMYEFYLPPYRAAVEAGAGSLMTSFNEINGVPSTANQWLLTDLLRDQWNFTGFVVTDFTAINELIVHGLGNLSEVSARAINAGVDMEMVSEGFLTTLNQSLHEGKVTIQTIDQACRRVLEAKYKLGLLDDPFHYVNESRAKTDIFTKENRLAARDFARRSFVLLKNDKHILPLPRSNLTITLVGPLADDHKNLLGSWSAAGDSSQTVSVLEGINQLLGDNIQVLHVKGSNLLEDPYMLTLLNAYGGGIVLDNRTATEMIDEALEAAKKSDVIVAVVGETRGMTGEASSRADIGLPACQQLLLQALFNTSKPVVIVLINGRPLTLTFEDQYATAILETWFAGTETGNAIAEVLFGYYNPAGKLTVTFPRSVGQIPLYYNHKNTGRPYNSSNFLDKFKVKIKKILLFFLLNEIFVF